MKKLLAMLLALVMVLSFAACGTPAEPEEPSEPEVPTEPEEPTEPEVEPTYAEEFAAEIEELKAKYAAPGLEVTDAFAEDVQKAIDDFIATYGGTENAYVVFDFDNTCSIFDVEEQLAVHQLRTMTFAFTPEELPEILKEGIGDLEEVRENDYSEPATYQAWINDIVKAYTYLYETYGPFTAKGLDEAAQAEIQADEQWVEFATKMRAMYSFVGDVESASVSYPWVLYWFTGMTEQEVYDLAFASHSKYLEVESVYTTWTSPETIESEAGIVTVEFTDGTCASEPLKGLWKALDEAGIDVWVCSASATDPIRAAIDAFGLHDYVTGMLAMTNVVGEDGKYVHNYDYETGCGWLKDGDGWKRDDAPIKAQTQGVGKVTAINNAILPKYNNVGPLACFMDSTGDWNFCTEYANTKLVINFNRANRKVTDGGGIAAAIAIYQRDYLGYDLATANANGDTLYVLQGREENGLRGLRSSNFTMRLGKDTELLFREDNNFIMLHYMIANELTTEEAINLFTVKTAAEDSVIDVKYGCVSEYAGYKNIK
ncbi:MAG: hypothetical protein J6C34_04075 [Oscillospiraceae bacterium]|nr:hypothetical protein [Oscillospiraceae bacterium]MBQ8595927.1 hypothetical protein [Oscillospiraceae bacterium]